MYVYVHEYVLKGETRPTYFKLHLNNIIMFKTSLHECVDNNNQPNKLQKTPFTE